MNNYYAPSTLFSKVIDACVVAWMLMWGCFLIFRYAATGKVRMVEDKLMQQKAQLLLDEAASWSLLWYLYGKGNNFL